MWPVILKDWNIPWLKKSCSTFCNSFNANVFSALSVIIYRFRQVLKQSSQFHCNNKFLMNFFLFWVDFPELLSCLCRSFSRQKNLHHRLPKLFVGMPVVRTDGRSVDVRSGDAKFSRMGNLPHFLTHGASLLMLSVTAAWVSYYWWDRWGQILWLCALKLSLERQTYFTKDLVCLIFVSINSALNVGVSVG